MTNSGNTSNCPQVIIHPDIEEDCSLEGGRVVTIQATVIGTGGNLSAQLDVLGSNVPPVFGSNFSATPLVLNWVGELAGGSDATIRINILEPANIPPTLASLHIPECAQPQIDFDFIQVNDCTQNGTRDVAVQATLTGEQLISANLRIAGNLVSSGTDPLNVVLAGSSPVPAGSIVPIVVDFLKPANTPPTSFNLHVPECDEVEVEIEVPGLCPQVSIQPAVGECDANGERNLSVSASITAQPGQTIDAQLLLNGIEVDAVSNADLSADLNGFIVVPAGSVADVSVNITEPANTPGVSMAIGVPACDEVEVPTLCPQVSINPDVGDCNEDGERVVSVSVDISGEAGQDLEAKLLLNGSEVDSVVGAVQNGTLNGSAVVPAGGSVAVEVQVVEPSGCQPDIITIQVPACDEVEVEVAVPTPCPQIVVNQIIGDCNIRNERSVGISADISGQPGQAIQAKLLINGVKIDSVAPAVQTATLTGAVVVPGGSTVEVEVQVEEPAGCQIDKTTIVIPDCDESKGDDSALTDRY